MMVVPKGDLKSMILENTPESVKAAKQLLGLSPDERIGFVRREVDGTPEYQPMIQIGDRTWYVGDEVLPPLEADIFDVFGEHPHVHPTSVEQAVAEFRELWSSGLCAYQHKTTQDLKAGISSVESRVADREAWMKRVEETQLRLARSIMAAGS